MPWALVALLVSSAVLAWQSWFFTAALGAQFAFYSLAALGAWLDAKERGGWAWSGKVARVAFTFVMMNYAAVAGLFALRQGRERLEVDDE